MTYSSKTLIVLVIVLALVATVTISVCLIEKQKEIALKHKLDKLIQNYTDLKREYHILLANYSELEYKYNELKKEYEAIYNDYVDLRVKYYDIMSKYTNIIMQVLHVKNFLESSKSFIQKVRELMLPISPSRLYTFKRVESYTGYVEPDNYTWYYLGTLHEGDLVQITVTPNDLIVALANSTDIITYKRGRLFVRINETDRYIVLLYNTEAWPEKFTLRIVITKTTNPKALFGDNSIESKILFKIARAYNYWYYNIRSELKDLTRNVTELSILYALSLGELLKSLGFNVKYAVIGEFPIVENDNISLVPRSIIPVITVQDVKWR